jgi:endonuclease/exonuclease/phosphatase (EEP) superfamily protein YafD
MGGMLGRAVRFGLCAAVLAGLLGILFSLAGRWSPVADSVAHFRHFLIAGTVLLSVGLLLMRRRALHRRLAVAALIGSAIGLADMPEVLPPDVSPQGERVRLVQLNLSYWNNDFGALRALLEREQPDVVTLQEVSRHNVGLLDQLAADYPGQVRCAFTKAMSVAILSRRELTGPTACGRGWATASTAWNDRDVTLMALHLHWPWPFGQQAQVDEITAALGKIDGPLVLAGDFNAAPWSATVRRLARASATSVVPGLRQTIHLTRYNLPLPIDHVLLPEGWPVRDIRVAEKAGSDHSAVVAEFWVPAP